MEIQIEEINLFLKKYITEEFHNTFTVKNLYNLNVLMFLHKVVVLYLKLFYLKKEK